MNDLMSMWTEDVAVESVIIEDESATSFGQVVFSNGLVLPITYLTDANGEVVDWDECVWIHFGTFLSGHGKTLYADLVVEKGTLH